MASKNGAALDDLGTELNAMKAEVDILKRSVPEGKNHLYLAFVK